MPSKKSRKAAKKSPEPAISAKEAAVLVDQVDSHRRSETAWLGMTSSDDEDDGWTKVEEHLLNKSQQQSRSIFRWKHFAK